MRTQGLFYDVIYDDRLFDDVYSTTVLYDDGDYTTTDFSTTTYIRRRRIYDDRLFDDDVYTTTDFSTTGYIRRRYYNVENDVLVKLSRRDLFLTNFTGSISHKTFYDNIFFS